MKTNAMSVLCRLVMAAAWVSAAMFSAYVASGQESRPTAKGQDESQESVNKRQLAVMRRLAETIQVTVAERERRQKAKLIPEPLFRFSDQSRLHSDGSVWAWSIAGRPVAMAEFRTYDRTKGVWGHDLVATSDVQLSAEVADRGRWAPREPDFKLLAIPNIGAPAKTEAGRLRQMKQFARSLSASEIWQGQRSELRLLPTEFHRYSDAASGLVDGAVFIFVVGSNPEAILFVEAHQAGSGELSWKYGLARMSAARVTFLLDDTEVWEVPESHGDLNTSYYSFRRNSPEPLSAPAANASEKTIE
ncbi:MAG: hypothetical protein WD894_01400 [Pirellulales bacterium]